MAKSKATAQAPEAAAPPAPTPEAAPQPPAPQYYQQTYAPRPPKKAVHPGMELGLAVVSALASAWLFVGAVSGSIGLFGGHAANYDGVTTFFLSHLGSFTGVVVVSLLSVLFAGLAFILFRRSNDALESDEYKGIAQAGAAIAVIKTLILAGTTVAVGLTPLLTIQKGSNVGPVYLYDFLPLVVATGLFVFVSWYMIKLVGRQKVGAFLSTILLITTSVVFVLGFVAVIVKSHSKSSSYIPSTSESRDIPSSNSSDSNSSSRNSSRTENRTEEPRSSSNSSSYSACYDDYKRTEDMSAYSKCIQEAYGGSSSYDY